FLYFYYFKHYRFAHDTAYLNRMQAPKKVKERLDKAKQAKESGNDKVFYDTLFNAMQAYLSVKLDLSIGALNSKNIAEKLKNYPVLKTTDRDIQSVWEECESVRYASAAKGAQEMESIYQKTLKIIDDIEKVVRS
ncbi:MAG: hypothetical protein KC684_09555, partial [Candidatus Omnitrophica bacterium]|nr:hypothetical protein [Candidatus Omnitrophota bacterium]